jgi:outer membrane protein OmpA-like peptidoglycan-associated protein
LKNPLRIRHLGSALALFALLSATGCATMSDTQKGVATGAGAGGLIGAVIGNNTGSTARGAIIGAILGGAAGGVIGRKMDTQAKQLSQSIPGATVERVGEGIQITFASGLLFDTGSDEILSGARHNLDALAENLNQFPETNLMIVGHTDNVGTNEYNQGLSERRADSASRYLSSHGVSRGITTHGLGETEPVSTNDSDSGRQRNRRVEIAIYANANMKEQARREAGGN